MRSHTTRSFRELFAALPARVQKQARESYRLFRENPRHPGLHFKGVHADPPTYSARVGIGYRVVGVLEGDTTREIKQRRQQIEVERRDQMIR